MFAIPLSKKQILIVVGAISFVCASALLITHLVQEKDPLLDILRSSGIDWQKYSKDSGNHIENLSDDSYFAPDNTGGCTVLLLEDELGDISDMAKIFTRSYLDRQGIYLAGYQGLTLDLTAGTGRQYAECFTKTRDALIDAGIVN